MTFATEITAIWGGRGSGKSTLGRKLLSQNRVKHAVLIDPMSPWGNEGVPDLVEDLQARDEARVIMRSARKADQVNSIFAAYLTSTKAAPWYCLCDEAPAYLDKSSDALSKVMFQGRHRAFGMMILGQRPNAVAAQIRSQAAVTYWGRLTDHVDLAVARQTLGRRADTLPGLKPGEFIRHPPEKGK